MYTKIDHVTWGLLHQHTLKLITLDFSISGAKCKSLFILHTSIVFYVNVVTFWKLSFNVLSCYLTAVITSYHYMFLNIAFIILVRVYLPSLYFLRAHQSKLFYKHAILWNSAQVFTIISLLCDHVRKWFKHRKSFIKYSMTTLYLSTCKLMFAVEQLFSFIIRVLVT